MIEIKQIPYDVVLDGKYYLGSAAEDIMLTESIDSVAMRAEISLAVIADLPDIAAGQEIRVSGVPFGGEGMKVLFDGVVWEVQSTLRGAKHLDITAYDRGIYLARSEDEYLFNEGTTATTDIKKIASDWGIGLGQVEDTKIPLSKRLFRARTLYDMMFDMLRETAAKGGGLYRIRLRGRQLDIVLLGSNDTVWGLESTVALEELVQNRTLEGTVTQVKVLGAAMDDERSPQLAIVKGEIDKYGTLQRIIIDESMESTGQAKTEAQQMLSGMQETFSTTSLDINTIRVGDVVELNGLRLIVVSMKHRLGSPGHMYLDLGTMEHVRRRFYAGWRDQASEEF